MSKKSKQNTSPFLEKACLFFIKSGIYLSLFTPFIVSQRSFFPFVTPKTIYFRVLIEIVFAFYLILAIFVPKYRLKLNSVFICILAFILILILTSVLGINVRRSFWSVYERMTGIFTFLHLLAFFIVLTSVFKDRDDWRKFLAASILAGIFICVNLLIFAQISTRGGGTIGNTSFLAAYLLFDIFFALLLFMEKKSTGWQVFSGISLLFFVPILLTSTARGAIISFCAGLFLIFLGYLIFSKKKKYQTISYFLIFFIAVLVLALLIIQPQFAKDKISQTLREMRPRLAVWGTAWKGFLERPIFGWGLENFNVIFSKFFNSCMFTSECGGEIWFDRAHNIVLDTLTSAGVVGFLTYLFIFEISIFNLLKICFKREENMFGPLIMTVLLIVYFFQNMLVFDMISSYTVFFLTMGFISFLIEEDKNPFLNLGENISNNFSSNKKIQQIVIAVVVIPTVALLYYGNIQPYLSARNIVNMIILAETLEERLDYFKKALNTHMEKYETREQFAQEIYQISLLSEFPSNIGSFFEIAEEEMQKSVQENPLDFRPLLFLGKTYLAHYAVSYDEDILALTEKTLREAINMSPTNQQPYWYLAELSLYKNDNEAAHKLFQKAIDLEPDYGKAYWFSAMAYKMKGEFQLAFAELKKAEEHGYEWKETLESLRYGGELYEIIEGPEGLVKVYEQAVTIASLVVKPEVWANLAASYANVGRLDDAKQAALKVIELDPSLLPSVEKFLKDLELE